MFASLDSEGKLAAESLLASRSDWAKSLLQAMDAQTISENAISIAAVRRMNMHQDAELAVALQKRWGNLRVHPRSSCLPKLIAFGWCCNLEREIPNKERSSFSNIAVAAIDSLRKEDPLAPI